jgi:lipopolysaccharide/colanic/teichoic acid biosynthesis glycosyltransferase
MSRTSSIPDAELPSHPFQRVFDCFVALPVALAALPVVLLAGLAVKLTSRGPMFYMQRRAGRGERPFHIFKIRTMRHNCEVETGACWSVAGDPRVTRIGRLLRKLHLDELPQLWNVLRGEMSIVGPRPERPEILDDLEASIPNVRDRLLVRPGVTGLAQIQQPPDVTPDCFRRKLLYDRHYIRHRGLLSDIRILFGTALYLGGLSYVRVRRLAGLSVPLMPDEVLTYRVPTAAREPAPLLESQPGVSG